MKVGIIGGGAAGFFAAIAVKENHPNAEVVILEKTKKVLSKVKISGGGRCNVTNACQSISLLSLAYPRGGKKLKKAFKVFSTGDTIDWFEQRNVPLVTQEDQCIFPKSQDSQSVIDCFLGACQRLSIDIELSSSVESIRTNENKVFLKIRNQEERCFDKVIVATGGSPKRIGLEWLEQLGHKIEDPVPSLFTFNMPSESIKELMGIVVEKTQVSIQGTKLKSDGPLLITHWGMSGPAILKLSAFGARDLYERNYEFKVQINWVNEKNFDLVKSNLDEIIANFPKKILANYRPYLLPERLWHFLLNKINVSKELRWGDLSKKVINKIISVLSNDVYDVKGKTTFKEEFVTCGGVSLESINFKTMESLACNNLYFAGEVMDIDAITGGYNFQAAWTTAFIAGKLQK